MELSRLSAATVAATLVTVSASAQIYSMGANPQGSMFYAASAALAKVATTKLDLQIRVQPMAGSSTYIPLINSGEIDIGYSNVDDTLSSIRGTGNFAGKPNPNLRILAVMFPLPLSVLVVNDSPAKSIKDLKGLRWPSGYPGQTTGRVLQDALLASVGLTMADVRPVPVVNLFKGVDALGEGKVDAAVIGPPVAQIQQANIDLSSRGGVRFLPVDDSPTAIAAMRKYLPVRSMVLQPAPHLVGVVGPTTFMIYSIYLTTNSKMSDEMAYKLVKMLHASREDLASITPVLVRFDPKRMTEQVDAPWHPGAIKFYTEINQWPPTS